LGQRAVPGVTSIRQREQAGKSATILLNGHERLAQATRLTGYHPTSLTGPSPGPAPGVDRLEDARRVSPQRSGGRRAGRLPPPHLTTIVLEGISRSARSAIRALLDPTLLEARRDVSSLTSMDSLLERNAGLDGIDPLEPFEMPSESDRHHRTMADLLTPNESDVRNFGQ
jgi:hypothetical protein